MDPASAGFFLCFQTRAPDRSVMAVSKDFFAVTRMHKNPVDLFPRGHPKTTPPTNIKSIFFLFFFLSCCRVFWGNRGAAHGGRGKTPVGPLWSARDFFWGGRRPGGGRVGRGGCFLCFLLGCPFWGFHVSGAHAASAAAAAPAPAMRPNTAPETRPVPAG